MRRFSIVALAIYASPLLLSASLNAQTAPPPEFGEDTRGEPAVLQESPQTEAGAEASAKALNQAQNKSAAEEKPKSFANNLLGEATIKESRRENGQVYRIELEHSAGGKQYIEENDSDGLLSSDDINLEDTPNLPKWKLGSW